MNRYSKKDKLDNKLNIHKKHLVFAISLVILLIISLVPYNMIFTEADTSSDMLQGMNIDEHGEGSIENTTLNITEPTDVKDEVINTVTNEVNNEIKNEVTNTIKEKEDEKIENSVSNKVTNKVINTVTNTVTNEKTDNVIENTISKDSFIENTVSSDKVALLNDGTSLIDDPAPLADATLTATLWDTNQYAAGTGTALSETGVEILGWEHETSKYLQIDPGVPADGNTYSVSVILPEEFYIVATELALPAGYQKVDFEKNEDIVINDTTNITLNKYSGTAKYTLNNMGVSGTIQLEMGYDVRLWDKQKNSSITATDVYPIVIVLSRHETDGSETELKKVYVSKVTSSAAIINAMSMSSKIEGESLTTSTPTVAKDKTVTIIHGINDNEGKSRYKFYPSVNMEITLPYYTHTDGKKYYLPVDLSTLSLGNIKFTSYTVDSSLLESSGIIKVNIINGYWNTGNIFSIVGGPLTDELLAIDVNSFKFSGGKIIVTVNGKNGNTGINFSNTSINTITYQKETLEKVTLSGTDKSVTLVERPDEAVSLLGGFYLSNTGTGDSCGKDISIVFDNQNTNKIKVTTYNSFADTIQEYILINYTLVDDEGNKVYLDASGNRVAEGTEGAIGEWTYNMKNAYYKSTTKANLRNKLTRAMLPEAQRGYYFKTIDYRLEQISTQTSLVATSAAATLTGSGNYLGYVDDVNGTHGEVITSTFVVKSDNTAIADLTRTVKTTLQTTSNPTYTIDGLTMSKASIQAGESVVASGNINAVTYPYGNSTWIKKITLAVILPKDVSVNEQSITLKYLTGSKPITGFTVENNDLGNGNVLWKIILPTDVYVGVANENLGNLSTGLTIKFNMQLDTAYTMNGATLFAKDLFFAAGYNQSNSAGGSYAWAKHTDIYDLNQNGSTTDGIAGARSTTATSCQVVSQTATLDISDSISIERQGIVTQESNEDIILNQNDIVNYNLDIGCFSGGRAEGFSYYIPVPKTTSVIDNFLIDTSSTGMFDFDLKDVVTVTGSDIFKIEYAFEEGLSYTAAQEFTTWYTAEQIEADDTLFLENVSMIKLTVKDEGIQNGDESRITAKFVYGGTDYLPDVGMENIWHSGGFYKHINSDRESAGNFATDGAKVTVNCVLDEFEPIVLTAAKNMMPVIPGNTNSDVLARTNFSTFKNEHTFSVTNVETYNVDLQSKEYIFANTDMPGIEANRTFAITVKLDNGNEVDILSIASTTPIKVGSIQKNSAPEFTFNIYNANAITDNSQTRYIIVTLESDAGLTIKQRININREIAGASDPKSAIVAGERYLTFDDTSDSVTISQDSAFTAQFIVEYIPDIYSAQKLIFSNSLPSGTRIILENLTDEANPTYWYYKVGLLGTSTIDFEDFVCMGKTGNDKYIVPTGIDLFEEKILVLVDFSECSSYLSENTYTVKMMLTGQNNVEDFDSGNLNFVIRNKSVYTLNDISDTNMGQEFEVGYNINLTGGANSKYEGRKISLVISALDTVPEDLSLTYLNTVYYLNSKDEFIIPLGDIVNSITNLKFVMNSNMVPENDVTYDFEAALWVSATANHEAPKLGEKIGTKEFTVSQKSTIKPSLKVKSMDTRIIHRKDLSKLHTATYEYIPVSGCKVTVELQQKIGTAYQKVTDRLNQVNNTTEHNMGMFNLSPSSGNNTIEFKLSTATSNYTYRLLYKVYDSEGNILLNVPYNFIVVD